MIEENRWFLFYLSISKVTDVSILDQLQAVDDYFPLLTEQTMQLYALRMRDNEDQADIVVRRDKAWKSNAHLISLFLG